MFTRAKFVRKCFVSPLYIIPYKSSSIWPQTVNMKFTDERSAILFMQITFTSKTGRGNYSTNKPKWLTKGCLAIPVSDRIADLINRCVNSNRGFAYANGFPSWCKTTTDIRSLMLNYFNTFWRAYVGWMAF